MEYCLTLDGGGDEEAREVATIHGGRLDGKVLATTQRQELAVRGVPVGEKELVEWLAKTRQRIGSLDRAELLHALDSGERRRLSGRLTAIYEAARAQFGGGRRIALPGGSSFRPVFGGSSERWLISGCTGSGKSTLAGQLMEDYRRQYPDNRILVVSVLAQDTALDRIEGVMRVNIDKSFASQPVAAKEFENSLVVFDDVDVDCTPEIQKALQKTMDAILQTGRHYNTALIYCNHVGSNYQKTRQLFADLSCFVFFPTGLTHQARRILSVYVGLDRQQVKRCFEVKSRWVAVHSSPVPPYVLGESECFLLGGPGAPPPPVVPAPPPAPEGRGGKDRYHSEEEDDSDASEESGGESDDYGSDYSDGGGGGRHRSALRFNVAAVGRDRPRWASPGRRDPSGRARSRR